MKIKVEINELVFHGFNYHDRMRIGAAIEQELVRLIGNGGLPKGLAVGAINHVPSVDAGSLNIKNQNPSAVGAEIARSLFNALNTSKAISR